MFKNFAVIDAHGHMSSPPAVRAFAFNLGIFNSPQDRLELTDQQVEPAMERHLSMLDERNIDVQLLSARPVAMMHYERPAISAAWTRTTNDLIAQQCRLRPNRFVGVAQLPQSVTRDTSSCVGELRRAIEDLGFVAATVNPDPGADAQAPGLDDPYWFPLYEAAEGLNATLIIHPGLTRERRLDSIKHSYQFNNIREEALATLLLENSDVFERYPRLRIMVCHCGGVLDRFLRHGRPLDAVAHARGADNLVGDSKDSAGGQVGMPVTMDLVHRAPDLSANLFFDSCAYDPYFLGAALRQRGVERIVFGTEVPGSASHIGNPETGRASDDVLATLQSLDFLTTDDIITIVNRNPKRVFPLMEARMPELFAAVAVS